VFFSYTLRLVELSEALKEALNRLLASGRVKVQENGSWLASLENFQYEVREKSGAILLHLWSSETTFVRRVSAIQADEAACLKLNVTRFGRARPDKLEFICTERNPEAGPLRREQFRTRLAGILTQHFPDEIISSLTAAPDLEHSLSGNYVRGITTARNRGTAVMAAAPGESSATYDALLTFGLLWLDRARSLKSRQPIGGLRLFFPKAAAMLLLIASRPFPLPYSRSYSNMTLRPAEPTVLIREMAATSNRGSCRAGNSKAL
jgi:hypothetical protein